MKIRGVHLSEFIAAFERLLPNPVVTVLEKSFQRFSDRVFSQEGPVHTRALTCDEWTLRLEMVESGGNVHDMANVRRVVFAGDEDAFMRDIIAMKMLA